MLRSGQCVTERARETGKHRGLEQKRLHLGGLAGKHLLGEVVEHKAMTAGEGGKSACNIGSALERERGELQASNPAFCTSLQGRRLFLRQTQPHHLCEERTGLGGFKA